MHLRFCLFVVLVGGLAHLILFIADHEISAGVDRLAQVKLARPDALNANLKLVGEHSLYMHNER